MADPKLYPKKVIRIEGFGKPTVNWYDPRYPLVRMHFRAGEEYEVEARVAAHAVAGGWGVVVRVVAEASAQSVADR